MRTSLVFHTSGRLRLRIGAPLSYSSSSIGSRSHKPSHFVGESSSSPFPWMATKAFFPRKQAFSRKRALYFSSKPPRIDANLILGDPQLIERSDTRQPSPRNQPSTTTTAVAISPLARNGVLWDDSSRKNGALDASFVSLSPLATKGKLPWNFTRANVSSSRIEYPRPWCRMSLPVPTSRDFGSRSWYGKIPIRPMATSTDDKNESAAQTEGLASASVDGSDTNAESTSTSDQPPPGWKRVRTIKVPQYGPDADKAVRSLQNARKERARIKTSINVQRALYGNMVICAAKLGAWVSSGSSAMLSEFVHSVVDCGNQALLLVGLRQFRNAADKRHPYGYGKSVYFWALVSALGTFFMGAGVSMSHSVQTLFHPTLTESIASEVWFVLAMSFVIDGYVFFKTLSEVEEARPRDVSMAKYIAKLRDPATLAVLLEDGAACLGIVIAIAGIGASYAASNPIYDGIAGVGISCLLASVGLALCRVNHSFLIGQAVDREMLDRIENIIRTRRSIENVTNIQSQWTGPETFSFKAELDFDGTYLSALLMPRYRAEFQNAGDTLDEDLEVLLSWYAEDVIRCVEREVRHIEAVIRQHYPGAEYIELEPMSKYVDRFAIDDSFEEKLLTMEKKELKKWVRVLYENKEENAWKTVNVKGDGGSSSDANVVSGAVPSDTLPEGGSSTLGGTKS